MRTAPNQMHQSSILPLAVHRSDAVVPTNVMQIGNGNVDLVVAVPPIASLGPKHTILADILAGYMVMSWGDGKCLLEELADAIARLVMFSAARAISIV